MQDKKSGPCLVHFKCYAHMRVMREKHTEEKRVSDVPQESEFGLTMSAATNILSPEKSLPTVYVS